MSHLLIAITTQYSVRGQFYKKQDSSFLKKLLKDNVWYIDTKIHSLSAKQNYPPNTLNQISNRYLTVYNIGL